MSEKLTARLSDGTEWEVVERCNTPFDVKTNQILDGYDRVLLKPLKPSPPKEVFVNVNSDGRVDLAYAPDEVLPRFSAGTFHRYILAPEPEPTSWDSMVKTSGINNPSPWNALKLKQCRQCGLRFESESITAELCKTCWKGDKKPAREWWDVRYLEDGRPYTSFESEGQAKAWCQTENGYLERSGHKPRYEVVHVREVV